MMEFLFSAKGRVSRKDYWLKFVLPMIGVVIVVVLIVGGIAAALGEAGAIVGLVVVPFYIALIWASICVGAKRFHDRGWSGWWVFYFFLMSLAAAAVQYGGVLLLGPDLGGIFMLVGTVAGFAVSIWQLVILGFLPGEKGPNQYGADPLDPNGGTAETFA